MLYPGLLSDQYLPNPSYVLLLNNPDGIMVCLLITYSLLKLEFFNVDPTPHKFGNTVSLFPVRSTRLSDGRSGRSSKATVSITLCFKIISVVKFEMFAVGIRSKLSLFLMYICAQAEFDAA